MQLCKCKATILCLMKYCKHNNNSMILTVHTNWEYIRYLLLYKHYNTFMISIEGKRQDQYTLMKANNRKADITPNDYCTISIMD